MILFQLFIFLFSVAGNDNSLGDKIENDLKFLDEIRTTYYEAVEDEAKIDVLKSLIEKKYSGDINNYPPIIIAYRAGVEALKSKHAFWPITKLNRLNDSMEIFKKAVNQNPANLEIRFMRFSILHYVPSILGFSEEREKDLNEIIKLLKENKTGTLSNSVITGIADFIIESGRVTEVTINEMAEIKKNCESL